MQIERNIHKWKQKVGIVIFYPPSPKEMIQSILSFVKNESTPARRLRQTFSVLLFCVFLAIVVLVVPWRKTWEVLILSDLMQISIAVLLSLPVQYLNALSFHIIVRNQKMQITTLQIWAINLIVGFYEIFLPATIFGSGMRWYRFTRQSNKPAQSLAALTYYKVFNVFLVLLLGVGFILFFDTNRLGENIIGLTFLFLLVAAILVLMPIMSKWLYAKLPDPELLQQKTLSSIVKYSKSILAAFIDLRLLGIGAQLSLIAYGLLGQFIQIIAYLYFARAVGITLSLSQLGAMRVVLLLATNLPVNFSPGIGLREVSLVALLTAMGIEMEFAVAMATLIFARTVFFGVIGGLIKLSRIVARRKEESLL